jgi:hypothetical protein
MQWLLCKYAAACWNLKKININRTIAIIKKKQDKEKHVVSHTAVYNKKRVAGTSVSLTGHQPQMARYHVYKLHLKRNEGRNNEQNLRESKAIAEIFLKQGHHFPQQQALYTLLLSG